MSGSRCMPEGSADCGVGRGYCEAPLLCSRSGSHCLTAEQAAREEREERERREAAERERKRKIDEAREAARRKEEERKQEIARKKQEAIEAKRRADEAKRMAAEAEARRKADEAARRMTELQAKRQGINSIKPERPAQGQTVRVWNPVRIRNAQPLPLPRLDPGAVNIRPLPRTARPPAEIVAPNDIVRRDKTVPANLSVPPLKWAGKFFFTSPKGDGVCSAQFIAPHVILTAAHCVRDQVTGTYNSNLMFALQYHNGVSSRRYGWKCVATPDGWIQSSREAYRWDYAMVLVDESTATGNFGWQANWQDTTDSIYKIGYPVAISSGQVMQVDNGPLTLHDGLVSLRHGNPKNLEGSSGGAWVARYRPSDSRDVNYAISVSSFYLTGAPDVAYGPAFGPEFKRLLEYVSSGCP
jgi:hypothetical protein